MVGSPNESGIEPRTLAEVFAWPAQGQHIRLNMAVDVNGGFTDASGRSSGLSSPEDRNHLKMIRSGADAIVVGAGTIRAEGWNLPRTGMLYVLSTRGNLPWETCPDPERVTVLEGSQSVHDVVQTLATPGVQRILVEGGGSVARQFAAAQLFDDVCLTVSSEIGRPQSEAATLALERLLDVSADSYDLVSIVPVATTPSVFTLWRRALGTHAVSAD